MKIKISAFCHECQKLADYKQSFSINDIVEFNDENLYTLICKKGHTCYSRLQSHKFELLFDQGAMAILDGYSRESVASFASCLERFIEHFIKVISLHHNVPFDNFTKSWKQMAKQSERQLGAFYILQTNEWKEILFPLNENQISFRNKVIHQGYIPATKEAINYGEYVLKFIISVLQKLKEEHSQSLDRSVFFHLMNSGKSIPEKVYSTTAAIPTIIGFTQQKKLEEINLESIIIDLSKNGFYKDFYKREM